MLTLRFATTAATLRRFPACNTDEFRLSIRGLGVWLLMKEGVGRYCDEGEAMDTRALEPGGPGMVPGEGGWGVGGWYRGLLEKGGTGGPGMVVPGDVVEEEGVVQRVVR